MDLVLFIGVIRNKVMGALSNYPTFPLMKTPRTKSAKKKAVSHIDSSISYLVVRMHNKPKQTVVCKTKGEYTVSPTLVSYNEASFTRDKLQEANPLETYKIAKVTIL